MHFLQFIYRNNRKIILPIVLFALILVFVLYGVENAADSSGRLQYDVTARAISRALADCYAIEGYYPPNMNYLYDNYNVRVDEDKYFVLYEIFAPNVSPTVKLIDRRTLIYE